MKKMSDDIEPSKLTKAERHEQNALREARENEEDLRIQASYENETCTTVIVPRQPKKDAPAAPSP